MVAFLPFQMCPIRCILEFLQGWISGSLATEDWQTGGRFTFLSLTNYDDDGDDERKVRLTDPNYFAVRLMFT